MGSEVTVRTALMTWDAKRPLLSDSTTSTPESPTAKPALVAVWSVSSTSAAMTAYTPSASSRVCIRTSPSSKGLFFCCMVRFSSGRRVGWSFSLGVCGLRHLDLFWTCPICLTA